MGGFRDTQPGAIHGGKNRAMPKVRRRFEQGLDLALAENDGELLLVPGQRKMFDIDEAMQGMAIEEAQPADGLNIGGLLYVLLIEQVQLPRADLFRAELVGRLVEVFGEFGDRADIAFHGCRRIVTDTEIFQHPLSECSHR